MDVFIYEIFSKVVKRVYVVTLIGHVFIWLSMGATGINLLYFIQRYLLYFLYPVGLYIILSQHQHLYLNVSIALREKKYSEHYFMISIIHTLIYAVCIGCMTIFIPMDLLNIEEVFIAGKVLITLILFYLCYTMMYLLLLTTKVYKYALLLPQILMLTITLMNIRMHFLNNIFLNTSAIVYVVCVSVTALLLMLLLVKKHTKEDEFYVEKI